MGATQSHRSRRWFEHEEIDAIAKGPQAELWSRHDRYLVTAADELHEDCCLSDETWAALAESYSTEQMMDLIFTCGQYRMLAGGLKSFGVQVDPGLSGFYKASESLGPVTKAAKR